MPKQVEAIRDSVINPQSYNFYKVLTRKILMLSRWNKMPELLPFSSLSFCLWTFIRFSSEVFPSTSPMVMICLNKLTAYLCLCPAPTAFAWEMMVCGISYWLHSSCTGKGLNLSNPKVKSSALRPIKVEIGSRQNNLSVSTTFLGLDRSVTSSVGSTVCSTVGSATSSVGSAASSRSDLVPPQSSKIWDVEPSSAL